MATGDKNRQIEKKCDDVLVGLECCKQFIYECDRCPYFSVTGERDNLCVENLHQDAIRVIEFFRKHQDGT